MVATAPQLEDPGKSRLGLSLQRLSRAWAYAPRGPEFYQVLISVLGSLGNRNTLAAYSFSFLEFWDWYELTKRTIVTPDQVRRTDALEHVRWLVERDRGLQIWRVAKDPDRYLDSEICKLVRETPQIPEDVLRKRLLTDPKLSTTEVDQEGRIVRILEIDRDAVKTGGLARRLACLVQRRVLSRTPTIERLRSIPPEQVQKELPFKYTEIRQPGQDETSRSSTVVLRAAAMEAIWQAFLTYEGGSGPLVKSNIWDGIAKQATRQMRSQQAFARQEKTPSSIEIERLIATTYLRSFGDRAIDAAKALMAGTPAEYRPERETFADLRDRAALTIMSQIGLRADEIKRLRLGDLSDSVLTVTGKGGKRRQLGVPPGAMRAIADLQSKLAFLANRDARKRAPSRRAEILLNPEAPLVPAVAHWGANAQTGSLMTGLSRQGLLAMLHRRANRAGYVKGSKEYSRAHPHGLRHLFTRVALQGGTPVNVVQAILGHESLATTSRYAEEKRPEVLVAEPFRPVTAEPVRPQSPVARIAPVPVVGRAPEPPRPVPVAMVARVPEAKPKPAVELTAPPETARARKALSAEQVGVAEYLARIYQEAWGEPKKTKRLISEKTGLRGIEEESEAGVETRGFITLQRVFAAMDLDEAVEEDPDEKVLVAEGTRNMLVNTYVGESSGLLWWYGQENKMKPRMPVPSERQLGECSPSSGSELCNGLSDIWYRWSLSEEPGPTAATALVQWLRVCFEESTVVKKEIDQRRGTWVEPTAALAETASQSSLPGDKRTVFREHDVRAIVRWFEENCWQYKATFGGGGKAKGEGKRERLPKTKDIPYEIPAYYKLADPISELSPTERIDLLDWIAAISGQPMTDRSPRFGGASRRDINELLRMFCSYDANADEKRELEEKGRLTYADGQGYERALRDSAAKITAMVSSMTGGRVTGFDIKSARAKRAAKRRAATVEAERLARYKSYLVMIADLFGEEASKDQAIIAASRCRATGEKTSEEGLRFEPADFFRIERGTITHTPKFAKEFADAHGAHSECVARRVARDLWEIMMARSEGSTRFLERPDELWHNISVMAQYKIPCPAVLESELRSRLREPTLPIPIFEEWQRSFGAAKSEERRLAESAPELLAAVEQEREFGERFQAQREKEVQMTFGRGRGYEPNPRAQSLALKAWAFVLLPTPIDLIAMTLL